FQGRDGAKKIAARLIDDAIGERGRDKERQGVNTAKTDLSNQYVFAKLEPEVIRQLVRLDGRTDVPDPARPTTTATDGTATRAVRRAIYRIWPDFPIHKLTTKSVSTVKAD